MGLCEMIWMVSECVVWGVLVVVGVNVVLCVSGCGFVFDGECVDVYVIVFGDDVDYDCDLCWFVWVVDFDVDCVIGDVLVWCVVVG